jgi:hypothetical protein
MRFDAYAGNVSGGVRPEEVATMAAWAVGGQVERGRPRRRYNDVFDVMSGCDLVGWVGRDATLDTAYFEFKGQATPETSGSVRKHWGDSHSVSRLDSCEDYSQAGAVDELVALMDRCADPRVKARVIAPRRGSDTGRTFYYGQPQSVSMVRVYEAGKMPERAHLGRPEWVRVENQVRPGKAEMRRLAAKVSPVEAWGFSAWTRRAAVELCRVELERFAPVTAPATVDRTTLYVARAHRRFWEEKLQDLGDWVCIGREFEAIWRQDDEAEGGQHGGGESTALDG